MKPRKLISKYKLLAGAAFAAVSLGASAALAVTEINWWHAMGSANGERVAKIAADFNASQSDFKVIATYKGNYTENMTAGIAAFRSGNPPHILQVFEVGTATMMNAKGAIKPVYEVFEAGGVDFDPSEYLSTVVGYYTSPEGKILSMPFNSSTPILWYNKDLFKKAGISYPPRTFDEIEMVAGKLKAIGQKCAISFGWQSWVLIENMGAWHNVATGTKDNGFSGVDTEFTFNDDVRTAIVERIAQWGKDGTFKYGGRRGDSLPLFNNGECAMWMNSSAYLGGIRKNATFEFGTAMLPVLDGYQPQNSIIGGATLWVFEGKSDEEYRGVAEFFKYLSKPEVQAWWHQETGYLPITYAAYELSKEQGYYKDTPDAETALIQMTLNDPTNVSGGIRFGNFVQVRDVINEELEAIWAGDKTAKEGLDAAVERGNVLLRKFERSVR